MIIEGGAPRKKSNKFFFFFKCVLSSFNCNKRVFKGWLNQLWITHYKAEVTNSNSHPLPLCEHVQKKKKKIVTKDFLLTGKRLVSIINDLTLWTILLNCQTIIPKDTVFLGTQLCQNYTQLSPLKLQAQGHAYIATS
jgi:accessory gene regulator protein AgrB